MLKNMRRLSSMNRHERASASPTTSGPPTPTVHTARIDDDGSTAAIAVGSSYMAPGTTPDVATGSNDSEHFEPTAGPSRIADGSRTNGSPVAAVNTPMAPVGADHMAPVVRIDDPHDWCVPEDAEGAYVRQTYAHFDRRGVRGDGLVEGKEWTRERSPKPAWVVAQEEEEVRRRRRVSSRRSSTLPTSNGKAESTADSSYSSSSVAPKRNGHLSPPFVTPRQSMSSLTQQTSSLDIASPDNFHDNTAEASGQLSAAHSTNGISASSSSVGSHTDDQEASVDAQGRPLLASDSDAEIDAERSHLLHKIDRYGFFPRPEEDGVRGRSMVVILPAEALKDLPRRRLLGRRSARSSRSGADGDAPRLLSMRRLSSSKDEDSDGIANAADISSIQKTLRRRNAKEVLLREREAMRVAKWDRMLVIGRDASDLPVYCLRKGIAKSTKLRRRVFKGIPDRWRASVWLAMLKEQSATPDDQRTTLVYTELQDEASQYDVQIDLDVPRTISGHILFHTRYGQGQRALFHALHAFSLVCKDCAYCQGMGPIAATLLVYFSPERAFDVMVALHDHGVYGLHKTFSPGFVGLVENFYVQRKLCEMLCPDVLAALDANDVVASAYATKWYITLFTNVMPFSTQLRLWDAYFYLGRDVLVVAATAVLWSLRFKLVRASFERCMHTLSREFVPEDDDVFMDWIFAVLERDETRKCLDAARREYGELVLKGQTPIL